MEAAMLSGNMLFSGMSEEEISTALDRLGAARKKYNKGEIILHAGDVTRCLGLVLSGSVTIERNDLWGDCAILSHVGKDGFFAETYAILPGEAMLVDVKANEDTTVLFLTADAIFSVSSAEAWAIKLTRNLLLISANKNLNLSGRSFHTAPKSVRGRVLAYLNTVSLRTHKDEFDIPFDRQQMADYLNTECTALSKELGRMQKDGVIQYRENHFRLIGR